MVAEDINTVGNASCCVFGRLVFRWRGSVYRLVWLDLLVFAVIYAALSCLYRFCLTEQYKRMFETVVLRSVTYRDLLPVTVVLGCYVTVVAARWWATCLALPDNTAIALLLATHLPYDDERSWELRTRIVRYVNLTYALVFVRVSAVVSRTFPDLQSLVRENLMTERECQLVARAGEGGCQAGMWVPLSWCLQLVHNAREEGHVETEAAKEALLAAMLELRRQCANLLLWHQYSVPLVYTQVVTLAVYTYFLLSVVAEQPLDTGRQRHEADQVVPLFAFLELVVYLGLLKVAEALINPFAVGDYSVDLLSMLEQSRYSAFVLAHSRYGQAPPEAPWRPHYRLHITSLGQVSLDDSIEQ